MLYSHEQIACLGGLGISTSIDCDNLDALTLPVVVAIKPTIPPLDRIDWGFAISLYPAAMVRSTILVIKDIAIAACVSVPLGLIPLATPCVVLVLGSGGLTWP